MRLQGRLTDWNDDKGYGFVTPHGGGERAFVHIKAFARSTRRPQDGDVVTYVAARDDKGRINASQVRFSLNAARTARNTAKPKQATTTASGRRTRIVGGLSVLIAITTATVLDLLPLVVGSLLIGLNLVTVVVYAMDKSAAQAGRWRTPENTLHLLAVLGGWPGALLAQGLLRHKSSKRSFQQVFWATVALNLLAVWAWHAGWLTR